MDDDNFWNRLAAGHTNTSIPSAVDQHLRPQGFGEAFESVRHLTDRSREAASLPLPVSAGTRVSFAGSLGAVLSIEDPPEPGAEGEVVTVRSANGEITHHEGKVFVKWDDGKFRSVYAQHLRVASDLDTARGLRAPGPDHPMLQKGYKWVEGLGWTGGPSPKKRERSAHDGKHLHVRGIGREVQQAERLVARMGGKVIDSGVDVNDDEDYFTAKFRTAEEAQTYFHAVEWGRFVTLDNRDAPFFDKTMKHTHGWKAASADPTNQFGRVPPEVRMVRVASLGDLTNFLKVSSGSNTLIHRSSKELWSFQKDADGAFLVERLFDDNGQPLKG